MNHLRQIDKYSSLSLLGVFHDSIFYFPIGRNVKFHSFIFIFVWNFKLLTNIDLSRLSQVSIKHFLGKRVENFIFRKRPKSTERAQTYFETSKATSMSKYASTIYLIIPNKNQKYPRNIEIDQYCGLPQPLEHKTTLEYRQPGRPQNIYTTTIYYFIS